MGWVMQTVPRRDEKPRISPAPWRRTRAEKPMQKPPTMDSHRVVLPEKTLMVDEKF